MRIKQALPHLAIAYQLPGPKEDPNPYYHDENILALLMKSVDRLHQRGFREGMLMPWKSRQVEGDATDKAVIVEFHLRTSGYALAVFLMRDELQSSDRLDQTLRTCRDVLTHGEKFGDPQGLKQNAQESVMNLADQSNTLANGSSIPRRQLNHLTMSRA